MTDFIAREALRRIKSLADAAAPAPDPQLSSLEKRVSLFRIVEALKEQRWPAGAELEYAQEQARLAGRNYDFLRPSVGFRLLAARAASHYRTSRALTVASGAQGGYAVGTDVPTAVADILRPWSIMARAGVTFLSGLRSNVTLPRLTGAITAYFLDAETVSITDSGAETLTQIAVTPHNAGGIMKVSRQLFLQAPGAEGMVATDFLRVASVLVDTAIIGGSGVSGQPVGLALTPGIGTQSLASATWSSCVAMKTTLGTANAVDDGTMAYIATPAVKGSLEGRDRSGGTSSGRFIIEDDQLNGLPAYASTVVPSGDMICGRWSDMLVPTWGEGLELEATPYSSASDFQSGLMTVRVMLSFDVALRYPMAFVLGTSFS